MSWLRWLPVGLPRAWGASYLAVCAATLLLAGIFALCGAPLTTLTRHLLRLRLSPLANPPPTIRGVLALAAQNVPVAAWPLQLGVLGAHRHRLARRIADVVVLACLTANVLPVAAALGTYGSPLLAYIPQLPVEWAGLALGAGAWLVQRQRAMSVREGLVWLALCAYVFVCAAVIETVLVPHR
jgi:hypothetical protein